MNNKAPLIILTAHRAWVYRRYPPFGIMFVARSLMDAGYRVKIVHPAKDRIDAVVAALREEKPLFLGLSVMQWMEPYLLEEDVEISRAGQEAGVPVVWGGVYPTTTPEIALGADYVDYLVLGEAELTVVEFAEALSGGRLPEGISGVGFKADGAVNITPPARFHDDLDRFEPAWELTDLGSYIDLYDSGAERSMMVPLSRGCPFKCTFCYNQSHSDRRRYRTHSSEWINRQVDFLKKKLGITMVRWVGDNPFGNVNKGMEVISAAGMPWMSASRIDLITEPFCEWLKESGCKYLGFGFESGSDRVLGLLQKGFTTNEIVAGTRLMDKAGIDCSATWIHLIPGETEAERRETRVLMDELYRLNPRIYHGIQGLRPNMGTPLWKKSLEMGIKAPTTNEEWVTCQNNIAPLFGWTERRLKRLVTMARLLYGRPKKAPKIVPDWQYRLFRGRFIRGSFPGALEEYLETRPGLRSYIVEH